MRKCLRPLRLLLLLLAYGCSSSPPAPTGPALDPLEQNAINALHRGNYDEAAPALDAALRSYEQLDDLAGQWRVTRLKTNLALSMGDDAAAATYADQLEFLARFLDRREVDYDTALILGRTRNSPSHFRDALDSARTPLEQAVCLTYLGDGEKAVSLIRQDVDTHPADRAFVFYSQGIATDDSELLARSLYYYRLAGDSRGISDALLRLARQAQKDNRIDHARDFANRAITVLKASGDIKRASATETWLKAL